jgi:8-oxo-dGTP diphosphatase
LMTLTQRPDIALCAASCHDARELLRAEELGLDFVVLGSVLATPSHPNDQPMGWDRLLRLTQNYSLPIYALGGLGAADQQTAWQHGAHGLAMLRNAWPA